MGKRITAAACSILLLFAMTAAAATYYVSPWGSSESPYSTWETAATNIQDAVNQAHNNDVVLVTNGVYNTGGDSRFGVKHRLILTNSTTIQSVNGSRHTVIEGAPDPVSGALGTNATRAVYMAKGTLDGFTVRRGYTDDAGEPARREAGGVLMMGGSLYNSHIVGNMSGGAGAGGWLANCLVTNTFFEKNTTTNGAGVHIRQQVRMKGSRSANLDKAYAEIGVIGTNAAYITNGAPAIIPNGTDFGHVDMTDGLMTHTFTITNMGVSALHIDAITTNGGQAADFVIPEALVTNVVNNHTSITFDVKFDPSELGIRETMLFVHNNDPDDDPFVIWLRGQGVEPDIVVLGTNLAVIVSGEMLTDYQKGTDFGSMDVTTGILTNIFTITNAGTSTLNLSDLVITNGNTSDFTITSMPAMSLATGEVSTFSVTFDPVDMGVRTSMVYIASDDPDTPYTFLLSGLGLEPYMKILGINLDFIPNNDVTPTIVDGTDFGEAYYGAITHTFTITNTGNSLLEMTGTPTVAVSGSHAADFTVSAMPSTSLDASNETTFAIRFFPSSVLTSTAEVSIVNNDDFHSNTPYTFQVIGAGSRSNQFLNIDANLHRVAAAAVDWGDYDNDGWLDLAMMGYDGTNNFTDVYRNGGDGTFTPVGAGIDPIESGRIRWGDYDADGYLDLAMIGYGDDGMNASIWRNTTGTGFTNIMASLQAVYNGGLGWGDYDNDGDFDLAISGAYTATSRITAVYRNDEGIFTNAHFNLPGLNASRLTWADFDNDGDLDLTICGDDGYGKTTKIYTNDAGSLYLGQSLVGVSYGALSWGDYDADGDLDLAVGGYAENGPRLLIYSNNGTTLVTVSNKNLTGIWLGEAQWADYDNDGDMDLLTIGSTSNNVLVSRIYKYENGSFTNIPLNLPGMRITGAAWGDYDNDGDLDMALAGQGTNGYSANIYRNLSDTLNTPPSAPYGLIVSASGRYAHFAWDSAMDAETASPALSYNLLVSTDPLGENVMPAMADTASGWRRVVRMGNVQHNRSWTLQVPTGKDIYWAVQAVDSGFEGGPWAFGNDFSNAPLPDLTIAALSYTKIPFTAYVTVSNTGLKATDPGTLSIWTDLSTNAACSQVADATTNGLGLLNPGSSIQITFNGLAQPQAGVTNVLRAYVDSGCTILEERTNNNQMAVEYVIPRYSNFMFNAFALQTNTWLRWSKPTDSGLLSDATHLRYGTASYPATTSDGTLLYTGTNLVYVHQNQVQGVTYYYTIWVSNDGTNWVIPPTDN
ncbi:MAG: choice-of-anchor D domain-containing protein [Spartobacteria bacterium]|nr:choice-of-anchor D domain-containing protein [Spartobacteria bacterium]